MNGCIEWFRYKILLMESQKVATICDCISKKWVCLPISGFVEINNWQKLTVLKSATARWRAGSLNLARRAISGFPPRLPGPISLRWYWWSTAIIFGNGFPENSTCRQKVAAGGCESLIWVSRLFFPCHPKRVPVAEDAGGFVEKSNNQHRIKTR